ncbi:hypothetical protein [Streptomyces sp. NPDC029674]|uniref:hypothetical protein n=1 Tax=Streptomyces sp. NPDC029674 TaxID=3365297 RepID=UPI0038514030
MLLPPQNLSQVFNGDLVASSDPGLRIPWPSAVLRRTDVEVWHRGGEQHAVPRIRAHIARAAQELHARTGQALRRAATDSASFSATFSNLTPDFGGADEVTREILALGPLAGP